MNGSLADSDLNKSKKKWVAFHLGSFVQDANAVDNNAKEATNSAIKELCLQFKDGRFRELQVTLDVDRENKRIVIKRWLDQVVLEEFLLVNVSCVLAHSSVANHQYLSNLLTFVTTTQSANSIAAETHVFQLESLSMVNYLASDIRSALEELSNKINKNVPVRVLPTENNKLSKSSSLQQADFESILRNEEITSKTERNLLLLNYCFDDIEFFLQHLKDQEDAQQALRSNKQKATDRLLEGRAKPSTQSAYIACIQKIKFSLNLLSKLQGKIRNPDSYELSRLLLDNLMKIAQAYNIYHSGGKLSKIKEPLLTDLTIKMLHSSLIKQQYKQLLSWGDFWIKPREKWSNYKELYYPEFFNGHQIDLDHLLKDGIIDELPFRVPPQPIVLPSTQPHQVSGRSMSLFGDKIAAISPSASIKSNNSGNLGNRSSQNVNLSPRQEDFCRSVSLRNGPLYRVISTISATKDEELSMSEGEIIEVVDSRPDRNWWLCTNMHGDKGYAPKTILEPYQYIDRQQQQSQQSSTNSSPQMNKRMSWQPPATSIYTSSSNSNNLRVNELKKLSTNSSNDSYSNNGHKNGDVSSVQEELRMRLNISPQPPSNTSGAAGYTNNPFLRGGETRASFARPGPVISRKHGQISINQDSSCSDVVKWLKFKKFNEGDIEVLQQFNGQEMFLLTRDHMNRLVGVDTAARLDSIVKVQKSLSGFGTMSKRELEAILLKRKEKVEFVDSF